MNKTAIIFILVVCAGVYVPSAKDSKLQRYLGTWVSDSTSVKMNFSYNTTNGLQLMIWDTDGEKMDIVKFGVIGDTIKTTEIFRSTNWKTYNIYYLKTGDSVVNIITGDGDATIYFTKEKCLDDDEKNNGLDAL